jgi:phage N-6-adenine-methyltransferase
MWTGKLEDIFLSSKLRGMLMAAVGRPRIYPDDKTKWREIKRRNRKAKQDNRKAYFKSKTTEWATPQAFFEALDREFHFMLDVAAQPDNAKCPQYFTPEENGLVQPWKGICWMNPPYGKASSQWVAKAYESAQQGATVVCLLPARTDTKWWQRYCLPPTEVRFVAGRLTFGGANNPAPFPNAVVIFRPPYGQEMPLEDQPLCISLALTLA